MNYILYNVFNGCIVSEKIFYNCSWDEIENFINNNHYKILKIENGNLFVDVYVKKLDFEIPVFMPIN